MGGTRHAGGDDLGILEAPRVAGKPGRAFECAAGGGSPSPFLGEAAAYNADVGAQGVDLRPEALG